MTIEQASQKIEQANRRLRLLQQGNARAEAIRSAKLQKAAAIRQYNKVIATIQAQKQQRPELEDMKTQQDRIGWFATHGGINYRVWRKAFKRWEQNGVFYRIDKPGGVTFAYVNKIWTAIKDPQELTVYSVNGKQFLTERDAEAYANKQRGVLGRKIIPQTQKGIRVKDYSGLKSAVSDRSLFEKKFVGKGYTAAQKMDLKIVTTPKADHIQKLQKELAGVTVSKRSRDIALASARASLGISKQQQNVLNALLRSNLRKSGAVSQATMEKITDITGYPIRSVAGIVADIGKIPGGLEALAKRPKAIPPALRTGAKITKEGLIQAAKGDPQAISDLIVSVALFKAAGKGVSAGKTVAVKGFKGVRVAPAKAKQFVSDFKRTKRLMENAKVRVPESQIKSFLLSGVKPKDILVAATKKKRKGKTKLKEKSREEVEVIDLSQFKPYQLKIGGARGRSTTRLEYTPKRPKTKQFFEEKIIREQKPTHEPISKARQKEIQKMFADAGAKTTSKFKGVTLSKAKALEIAIQRQKKGLRLSTEQSKILTNFSDLKNSIKIGTKRRIRINLVSKQKAELLTRIMNGLKGNIQSPALLKEIAILLSKQIQKGKIKSKQQALVYLKENIITRPQFKHLNIQTVKGKLILVNVGLSKTQQKLLSKTVFKLKAHSKSKQVSRGTVAFLEQKLATKKSITQSQLFYAGINKLKSDGLLKPQKQPIKSIPPIRPPKPPSRKITPPSKPPRRGIPPSRPVVKPPKKPPRRPPTKKPPKPPVLRKQIPIKSKKKKKLSKKDKRKGKKITNPVPTLDTLLRSL